MFDEIIENEKDNLIKSLCELIKFKSISEESDNSELPFGEECKKALDYTLNLASKFGFKTKNLNEYCGYIEFGEGEDLVGILGHLDVVPANAEDGWINDPFIPEIRENKLYGRGSIDDKGPVIASLYAMKAILDSGTKLNKRVRLILGLNEEKSWKCIDYYKAIGEETPTIGFSPDADFPTIYAEKGILSISIKHPLIIPNMSILEIDCNQNALNVVPKYCSITLKYLSDNNRIAFESNENITVEEIDRDTIKIISTGIASHAAHPDLGKNAITNLFLYLNSYIREDNNVLNSFDKLGLFDIKSPSFLSNKTVEDESGILTSNIGFANYNNNILEIGINLRVPVTIPLSEIEKKYQNLNMQFSEIVVNTTAKQEPLYVNKNSYLVQTLTNIFNKKTGLNSEPIAIGGGTYARAFPNCVAFGANMPGKQDMCHQVNEFIDLDTLILSSKIYAEAIYELAK